MRFGAHVSSAAPFSEAVNRAESINCECLQVFANAPQRWAPVAIPDSELEYFKVLSAEKNIQPAVIHSIYLINLASDNSYFYQASQDSIVNDLGKAEKMGALGVNTHLGSSKEKTFEEVLEKLCLAIKNILERTPTAPYFIIENSAGAGNIIGDTFEEIGTIIKTVDSDRVRVLLDTAHLFESGYPIHTESGLQETIDQFDKLVGLDRLVGLHLNDSQTTFNSKRDRHADFGLGEIGIDAIGRIINHPKLRDLFGIIETPSLKGKGDVDNLAILRSLVN